MTEPYYPSSPKGGIPNEVPLNCEIPVCFGTEPSGSAVYSPLISCLALFVSFRLRLMVLIISGNFALDGD